MVRLHAIIALQSPAHTFKDRSVDECTTFNKVDAGCGVRVTLLTKPALLDGNGQSLTAEDPTTY